MKRSLIRAAVLGCLLTLPTLTGCISAETRAQLAAANKAVAALEVQLAEAQACGADDLDAIRGQLDEAKKQLQVVADKAEAEAKAPIYRGADVAETAISTVSPIVAIIFPAANPILSLLSLIAGRIKSLTRPRTTA